MGRKKSYKKSWSLGNRIPDTRSEFEKFLDMGISRGPAGIVFDMIAKSLKKSIIFRNLRLVNRKFRDLVDLYCKEKNIPANVRNISIMLSETRILLIDAYDALEEIINYPKKIIIVQAKMLDMEDFTYNAKKLKYKNLSSKDRNLTHLEYTILWIIDSEDYSEIKVFKQSGYFYVKLYNQIYSDKILRKAIESAIKQSGILSRNTGNDFGKTCSITLPC